MKTARCVTREFVIWSTLLRRVPLKRLSIKTVDQFLAMLDNKDGHAPEFRE